MVKCLNDLGPNVKKSTYSIYVLSCVSMFGLACASANVYSNTEKTDCADQMLGFLLGLAITGITLGVFGIPGYFFQEYFTLPRLSPSNGKKWDDLVISGFIFNFINAVFGTCYGIWGLTIFYGDQNTLKECNPDLFTEGLYISTVYFGISLVCVFACTLLSIFQCNDNSSQSVV